MTVPIIFAYRLIWRIIGLAFPIYLRFRVGQGKEDRMRLSERYGFSTISRPQGRLYWLHSASIGETVSSLVLADDILANDSEATVLITSGTITSAEMTRQRITTSRIIHQYHPHDHPRWVRRFLDHWQPDLMVMVESEIWPNIITISAEHGIPVVMASAQISLRSLQRWQTTGRMLAKTIFPCIDVIMAVDEDQITRFGKLVANPGRVQLGGSMKAAAAPLADQPQLRAKIKQAADGRHIILFASSHDGEERIFYDAMSAVNQNGSYLAIIAPRHTDRGTSIHQLVTAAGDIAGQRSKGETITSAMTWWIADAMGEMGGLIRAADVVVLGGGFAPLGGHNPMEMAALGKGVISGRHVFKNKTVFEILEANQGVIFVDQADELADAIILLSTSRSRLEDHDQGALRSAQSAVDTVTNTASTLIGLVCHPTQDDGSMAS